MPILGQIIREIEREAASLSTAVLRHEIEINLEVQDAAIRQYYAVPPGGRKVEDLIMANSAVMVSRNHHRPVRPGTGYPARGLSHGRHQPQLARTTPRPGGVEVPLARLGLKASPLSRKQPV